jgi:hypothetical protein
LGPEENVAVNVCEFPEQIVDGAVTPLGSVTWLTVTVTEAQPTPTPQLFAHAAKYVVVVEGETNNVVPVPTTVAPQLPVYHVRVARIGS